MAEVFALTDEQILEIEPDVAVGNVASPPDSVDSVPAGKVTVEQQASSQAGSNAEVIEPPEWLARQMKDPWVGDQAQELWSQAQAAQRDAAAFRELFPTVDDARSLKQLYPGGVAEARAVAERARTLDEVDAALFGKTGATPEDAQASRAQFIERLHAMDPLAFRQMVEAGQALLARSSGQSSASASPHVPSAAEQNLAVQTQAARNEMPPENAAHLSAYREFENSANAELEQSVGRSIERAIDLALPNLKHAALSSGPNERHSASLRQRLTAEARAEVDTGLRSDAQLGEQIARILSSKRFDASARSQVVRLIDARAQQLVGGAVRRVVGTWTRATLGEANSAGATSSEGREARTASAAPDRAAAPSMLTAPKSSRTAAEPAPRAQRFQPTSPGRRGRVDYTRLSDEQILNL